MGRYLWRLCLAAALCGPAALCADEEAPGRPPNPLLHVVKRFDFDERPLGNFEELPRGWERLSGPGLPPYSRGQLDDSCGRTAAPSFRFRLQGGSIAYEYVNDDIPIVPGADHLVVAFIRAVGLEHAVAFVHTYLVDANGQPLPGTDRISSLVRSVRPEDRAGRSEQAPQAEAAEPWQRVEVFIPAATSEAVGLRLRLWVLQAFAFRVATPDQPDPIVRQDVDATIWFDDLTVYRLPHVTLSFSLPGQLVLRGQKAALIQRAHNSSASPLNFELQVFDRAGTAVLEQRYTVGPGQSTTIESPLPALPVGIYSAELRLCEDADALLRRRLQFAVAPEIPSVRGVQHDFGISLGPWRGPDVAGALRLVDELGCGTVKVGIAVPAEAAGGATLSDLQTVRDLAQALRDRQIATTAVLLPSRSAGAEGRPLSVLPLLAQDASAGPVFGQAAAVLGAIVTRWQLGDESDEVAADAGWNVTGLPPPNSFSPDLRALRRALGGFMANPEVLVCGSIFEEPANAEENLTRAGRPDAVCLYVPTSVPAWLLAWQLCSPEAGSNLAQGGPTVQLSLEGAGSQPALAANGFAGANEPRELAELARRVVLARAMLNLPAGPPYKAVYVRAPIVLSDQAGQDPLWCPTEGYLVLRSLFHYLSGRQATAVLPLVEQDGLAIVFEGPDSACLVAWTWRDQPSPEPAALYLGSSPTAYSLFGDCQPLKTHEGRTLLPLEPMPVIVEPVDAGLARLAASLTVTPAFVELHESPEQPVLRLSNPYAEEMTGTVYLRLPEYWRGVPERVPFAIPPGQVFEQPLSVQVPPREIAGVRPVGIQLLVRSPTMQRLEMQIDFTVGLRDIDLRAEAAWEADDLVIEHTLYNRSAQTVSFASFCRLPQRAQLEGVFLGVAPGETRVQRYVIPAARELAGALAQVGVSEIRGRRSLAQLVQIPP
jgi:hypothetical protein